MERKMEGGRRNEGRKEEGVEREVGGERRGSSDPSAQCFANAMASVWVASGLWTWQVALPTGVDRLCRWSM